MPNQSENCVISIQFQFDLTRLSEDFSVPERFPEIGVNPKSSQKRDGGEGVPDALQIITQHYCIEGFKEGPKLDPRKTPDLSDSCTKSDRRKFVPIVMVIEGPPV